MVAETQGWVAIGIAEPTSGRYALKGENLETEKMRERGLKESGF